MSDKCNVCHSGIKDDLNFGELKTLQTLKAHYYCLLLATNFRQSGRDHEGILGFLRRDIVSGIENSAEVKCNYCRKKGATIYCKAEDCNATFHLPCGLRNGTSHQFYGEFKSYCHKHRLQQNYNIPTTRSPCPVCYERINFKDSQNVLWAPCCKKNFFHLKCIQKFALSAGSYFFKCPVCNDKRKFYREMESHGVFIPQRDASWEMGENAFRELYVRHNECNAEICVCKSGRNYEDNNRWKILLCNYCGSQGIHVECSSIKNRHSWACSDCLKVEQSKKDQTDQNLNTSTHVHASSSNVNRKPPEATFRRRSKRNSVQNPDNNANETQSSYNSTFEIIESSNSMPNIRERSLNNSPNIEASKTLLNNDFNFQYNINSRSLSDTQNSKDEPTYTNNSHSYVVNTNQHYFKLQRDGNITSSLSSSNTKSSSSLDTIHINLVDTDDEEQVKNTKILLKRRHTRSQNRKSMEVQEEIISPSTSLGVQNKKRKRESERLKNISSSNDSQYEMNQSDSSKNVDISIKQPSKKMKRLSVPKSKNNDSTSSDESVSDESVFNYTRKKTRPPINKRPCNKFSETEEADNDWSSSSSDNMRSDLYQLRKSGKDKHLESNKSNSDTFNIVNHSKKIQRSLPAILRSRKKNYDLPESDTITEPQDSFEEKNYVQTDNELGLVIVDVRTEESEFMSSRQSCATPETNIIIVDDNSETESNLSSSITRNVAKKSTTQVKQSGKRKIGTELYSDTNGNLHMNIDTKGFRKLWNRYYVSSTESETTPTEATTNSSSRRRIVYDPITID